MTTFVDTDFGQQLKTTFPMIDPDWTPLPCLSARQFTAFLGILSEQAPMLAGIEVAARYVPMKGVSGDYCDFLPIREGQIGLAIGDVCGKGLDAAFLMASLCASLRARVQVCPEVGELLAYLNRITCRDTLRHQFVTMVYGIWDANSHTFTYSGAGHPPVLHYHAATGHVSELRAGGMVLGVYEEIEYPVESVSLDLGDTLVMYTDGIIEATDAADEVFGIHGLSEVLAKHGEESSEVLTEAILSTTSQFAHHGWEDDVTLLVMKRVDE